MEDRMEKMRREKRTWRRLKKKRRVMNIEDSNGKEEEGEKMEI